MEVTTTIRLFSKQTTGIVFGVLGLPLKTYHEEVKRYASKKVVSLRGQTLYITSNLKKELALLKQMSLTILPRTA